MRVLLLNGSPHSAGTTYTALTEVEKTLREAGVETDLVHIGTRPIQGCSACHACAGYGKCAFTGDIVNTLIDKMAACDGLVVGTPVYYASPNGALLAVLDRLFFAADKAIFRGKPAAAVACARRAGTVSSLDVIQKYFTISEMPVVSSQYWCCAHGNSGAEAQQDGEGMQILRTLGRNMAWLLRCIEAGKAAGVALPAREPRISTNFIRK